jgi:hypothetical protein
MPSNQEKLPSELSLDIFAARIAADQSLPQSVREAITDNQGKGASSQRLDGAARDVLWPRGAAP